LTDSEKKKEKDTTAKIAERADHSVAYLWWRFILSKEYD